MIGHLATGLAGAVLGIAVGIGAPAFYISRDNADEVSNKCLIDARRSFEFIRIHADTTEAQSRWQGNVAMLRC